MAGMNPPAIPQQPGQAPPIIPQPPQGPAPGILTAQALPHNSFASYYSDETKDPFHVSYGAILHRFDVSGPEAIDAATLQQMALGKSTVPNAYPCCASLNGTPRIYILHMPSKYIPALDGRVTLWDNKVFCFLGELLQPRRSVPEA